MLSVLAKMLRADWKVFDVTALGGRSMSDLKRANRRASDRFADGLRMMMSLLHVEAERAEHPVDVVERLASFHEWSFDRDDQDEISISVKGRLANYHVAFTWLPDLEALHVGCAFDLKVPDRRRTAILSLISLVNEHLWIGHFDLWSGEDVVMFRHSLLMAGGADPDGRQCEAILKAAVTACDRYYQAFQFVMWAGKSPREALDCVMFETEGEA